ncbi:alcohol dehydrogenase [Fusarium longipes]|uniref:Alcohol dehydrogenase n=1 Tax=Fusarium longipes TaxID=694270 RepID=A0A395SU93_9HYPO|nr:alcohol dehydrogenase [Fusarium longipes]
MSTQQVFRLPQRTSLQDLAVQVERIPEPAPHEVLIRIRAVSLNYRDFVVAIGKYPFPVKDNVVPCSDLAGDVVRAGSQVENFAKGDRVVVAFDLNALYGVISDWHHSLGGGYDGALREYIALPSSSLVKIPTESTLSYAQLSAIVCTGTTAWNALYGNVPLKPGQFVLFLGTGGVSVTGLILAKAAGARTIITSSSDSKLEYVQRKWGADYIINYRTNPKWSEKVMGITGGHGADHIFETGGAGTISESINAISYGGCISVIGFLAPCPQDKMPDVASLAFSKGAVVRGIMVGSKQQLEDVTRFVTAKNLRLPVEKEFGFSKEEVLAAFEYMASGQHIGKVSITVN